MLNLFLYHPLRDVPLLLHVKPDAHHRHRFALHGIRPCILAALYLRESLGGGVAELQFHYVYAVQGFYHHVGASTLRVLLHVDAERGEQGEDDVEHLLVVALVERVVAVGYGVQKVLQQLQRAVHVAAPYLEAHLGYRHAALGVHAP